MSSEPASRQIGANSRVAIISDAKQVIPLAAVQEFSSNETDSFGVRVKLMF
jgi:hypothetical protein